MHLAFGAIAAAPRAREFVLDRNQFADLVAAVAERRDQAAFGRLFDHFAPRINAYLLRTGTDNGTAEEITQEVMVTLWRKADLFDRDKSSVGTWFLRIARNRKIDQLRRNRAGAIDENDPMLLPDEDRPLDEAFDARRFEVIVRDVMGALPREQRDLINLAFFDGLSHSQIAEETSLPLGTVKSRIRLAFQRLKKALEERGIDGQF
jgi:RNA polymerase sigma-70 factor (ECF subfamily)